MMYVRVRCDLLQVLRSLFSPCFSVKGSYIDIKHDVKRKKTCRGRK